ncbi:MAG: branched-chain amino acid ABC transporter permease [Candidatus Bathyarchaeum sp.]|nr:MAG: branched-chain amino acid ABC transporter permease [Candidatus Bathyarchaeum sp.]
MIAEILISGLILGGLYALMSLGFALINGVARVFNLAHGSLYMLCAYFIYSLSFLGLGVSIVLSLILTIITGVLIYQFFIHPLREKKFGAAIVTLSLAIFLQALVSIIWGPQFISIPYVITGYTTIFGVRVVNQKLLSLIVAIILVIFLGLFINRTRVGKSIKAVAQNMDVAKLVGINTRNTFMISMGISALLAGFAAVLFAPVYIVSPSAWTILFRSFPVLVLGGLGSLKGALVGAFIIAFTEKIIEYTVQGGYLVQTVTFGVMLLIIFIKPEGIFGKKISK